ncbi:MAG: DUF5112 domain-containing protein [Bacteroidaceae bacterium]|nr:DUF5112 domain-containing protein [Bacteroidaceae bacterium]
MKFFLPVILCIPLFVASCVDAKMSAGRHEVDSLNERAYEWRYRDIDTVRLLATEAQQKAIALHYVDGEAEALNNQMAERFQQMDFDSVAILAERVRQLTRNQVELLIADVMLMKVAQRTGDHTSFYLHRGHAGRRVSRIAEEAEHLSPHLQRRFVYAQSDLHITASTYFYYADLRERALEEIRLAEPFSQLPQDTAQWLYYCYMRGSGGLGDATEVEELTREEFDYLFRCFTLAKNHRYRFFQANAAQSLATLFADSVRREFIHRYKPDAEDYLVGIFGAEETPMTMATTAFDLFSEYDDLYQEACALRTLGELSFDVGNYHRAIDFYTMALACVNFHHQCYYAPDKVLNPSHEHDLLVAYRPHKTPVSVERLWMTSPSVKTVPEWIAGIRQHLSVAFSALGMKRESDYNRNIYLDLLELTREDAEWESRYAELKEDSRRLRWALATVVFAALGVILLVLFLRHTWRRRMKEEISRQQLLQQKTEEQQQRQQQLLDEQQEQLQEQQQATELRIQRDKRSNVERHAKLQLVHGITPFLDRIIHEVNRMRTKGEIRQDSLTYICELTDRITQYNDLLTHWIQMEQGQLSLQLSSFPLEPLFDTLRKNVFTFEQKGIDLHVGTSTLSVKADRALTLFMLNTLADNARKFTPKGGRVTVNATEGENADGRYVELSVTDTGVGLSAQDIDLILNNKVYDAAAIGQTHTVSTDYHQRYTSLPSMVHEITHDGNPSGSQKGFGFGLMNCKGIIEKYRKTNPLFRVCCLGIESQMGKGSRFFFRLPRVMALFAGWVMWVASVPDVFASPAMKETFAAERQAVAWADSVYYCNLDSRFADAIAFADSALQAINAAHVQATGKNTERLTLRPSEGEPADWLWWQRRDTLDYALLLGLRNEIAVAALALNDWPLYRFNNRIYTRLYKLVNQDTSLEAYCVQTERAQSNERVAMVLMVLFMLIGLWATWYFYFRPRIRYRRTQAAIHTRDIERRRQQQEAEHRRQLSDLELAEDEHRRRLYEEERLHVQNQIMDNCLSTIKHETMYYPGRIQQLVAKMMDASAATDGHDEAQMQMLDTLNETVTYYKEIFSLLSAQADHQSAAVAFRRHALEAAPLLAAAERYAATRSKRLGCALSLKVENLLGESRFRGDEDLLTVLLQALLDTELTLASGQSVDLILRAEPAERFVRFSLLNSAVALTSGQLSEFFMPHADAVSQLLAKQVIREHETFLGHPGCRIAAEGQGRGHVLWFTLPMASVPSAPNV